MVSQTRHVRKFIPARLIYHEPHCHLTKTKNGHIHIRSTVHNSNMPTSTSYSDLNTCRLLPLNCTRQIVRWNTTAGETNQTAMFQRLSVNFPVHMRAEVFTAVKDCGVWVMTLCNPMLPTFRRNLPPPYSELAYIIKY
jgi:hypothetical protein